MTEEIDLIAFLWDQVKALSEKARQHDGQVQLGYSMMCKLENHGLIPHLKKPEAIEEVVNETVVEPVPALESEPIEEEPIPEPVKEEVFEEVEKREPDVILKPAVIVVEVPEEEKPIEADNIDDLLEQYKKKISE